MTELRFDARVALVSGAGDGLGFAHARMLARHGCQVVLADAGLDATGGRIETDTAALAADLIRQEGGTAVGVRGDILTDADAMVSCAIERFGRLDILVNNAGPLGSFALFSESRVDEWQRVSRVHYEGTVAVTRAAWPHLAASGSGRIINTSSAAVLGSERQTDYGSAKAALIGFTRSLAMEGRTCGITVNCIMPSAFTRMMETIQDEAVREATRRIMQPDHVAAFVAWLVHEDTAITGETFNVGGGRAVRVFLASAPAVLVPSCDPADWRTSAPDLFGDALSPMPSMLENFVDELTGIDPAIEPLMTRYLATGLAREPA